MPRGRWRSRPSPSTTETDARGAPGAPQPTGRIRGDRTLCASILIHNTYTIHIQYIDNTYTYLFYCGTICLGSWNLRVPEHPAPSRMIRHSFRTFAGKYLFCFRILLRAGSYDQCCFFSGAQHATVWHISPFLRHLATALAIVTNPKLSPGIYQILPFMHIMPCSHRSVKARWSWAAGLSHPVFGIFFTLGFVWIRALPLRFFCSPTASFHNDRQTSAAVRSHTSPLVSRMFALGFAFLRLHLDQTW